MVVVGAVVVAVVWLIWLVDAEVSALDSNHNNKDPEATASGIRPSCCCLLASDFSLVVVWIVLVVLVVETVVVVAEGGGGGEVDSGRRVGRRCGVGWSFSL